MYWNKPNRNWARKEVTPATRSDAPGIHGTEPGDEHAHEIAGENIDERPHAQGLIVGDVGYQAHEEAEDGALEGASADGHDDGEDQEQVRGDPQDADMRKQHGLQDDGERQ